MKSKLDLLELYFQNIIESGADLFWHSERINLVRSLIDAIEAEMEPDPGKKEDLPSAFMICLPPDKYALWHSDKEWIDRFSAALQEAAVEVGLNIGCRPVISLEMNPLLPEDNIQVHISHTDETTAKTAMYSKENPDAACQKNSQKIDAFLILEDGSHFVLDRNVTNIGRREDNEVILEDPHVSREHAQIRQMKNAFFLFDLNSTAGTYVNGRKIDQYALQPGDVISISDHPLIYVQEDFEGLNATEKPADIAQTTRIETVKKEDKKTE